MPPEPPATSREQALALDAADPLAVFRDEFVILDPDLLYLDGNSLGRLPKRTVAALRRVVEEEWAGELVQAWGHWLDLGTQIGDALAPLIGARPGEVALCDQTSINLYKLASAALAHSKRADIVTDAGNFPSDRYVLDGVAAAAGGRVRVVQEDPGPTEIEEAVDDRVGVVALSHVSYRSGALLDMAAVTAAASAAGAIAVWDLAHSAGAVPVDVAGCGVDLALGCTYKYLNGGPGAPGYLYVSGRLQQTLRQPIQGWFGHMDQFAFADRFIPAPDIRRFTVGTPSILAMTAAGEGIGLTAQAGIGPIRAKSKGLSETFAVAVAGSAEVVSPSNPEHRGSHITIRHERAWQVCQALRDRRVVVDFRTPDSIRFGFAPLYTTYDEVWRAAETLADVLASESYATYPEHRGAVT